jgi:hypothetical protein
MNSFNLPPILLDIPRNPVLAIGLPLVFGSLSGYPTSKVVNGPWYRVRIILFSYDNVGVGESEVLIVLVDFATSCCRAS